jgi:hypothetical protein
VTAGGPANDGREPDQYAIRTGGPEMLFELVGATEGEGEWLRKQQAAALLAALEWLAAHPEDT